MTYNFALEFTEDPASVRKLLGIHVPDVISFRLCLLSVWVEARNKTLGPEIKLDLFSRHGFFSDSSGSKLKSQINSKLENSRLPEKHS